MKYDWKVYSYETARERARWEYDLMAREKGTGKRVMFLVIEIVRYSFPNGPV
jgi:hypothetical protein